MTTSSRPTETDELTYPSNPFVQPTGVRGRLAGWLLARFNAELNRKAVERLALQPRDRVLEIGFGPGVGIRLLADRVPQGRVVGIDPSPEMLAQARARNRNSVGTGRVELQLGTAGNLPWGDGAFDAVLSLNNVLLWQPFEGSLREVRRVLRPGGRLLCGLHEWAARSETVAGKSSLAQVTGFLVSRLGSNGFSEIRAEVVPVPIGRALLVVGSRA